MKTRQLMVAACFVVAGAVCLFFMRHSRLPKPAKTQGYANSAVCVDCHAGQANGYAATGMARAFTVADARNTAESPAASRQFYHAASGPYYQMTERDGGYYQRRWQMGRDGNPENAEELRIDYVMGSGNHARTYLHREQDGTVIELPLGWYSEDGGHWGMNPGFDNSHPMTRRTIAYECMFCHNAYPQIPSPVHRDLSANPVYGAALPEGIDCQRCHGPGAAHIRAAQDATSSLQQVRGLILNPVRLSNGRQMEVCEQCHLETTSRPLPDRIRHYDQEPFGYNPAAPLAAFSSYFVRDPQKGRTDNFEIASAPYRLRQSQCYLQSKGALTCETCHNPHDLHKGTGSASYYASICMKCHAASLPAQIAARRHPASNECIGCHMPKRRTEDVVHVVMTDHLIQRRPPSKELLAERQEVLDTPANTYRGPVMRYLLDQETEGPDDGLYDAAAQVIDSSNLEAGVPALAAQIRARQPDQSNFSIELGDAMRHSGKLEDAIDAYKQALKLDALSSRAQRRLGVALGEAGQLDEARRVLRQALDYEPDNALLWYEKAQVESKSGDSQGAVADLRKALQLKPDFADAQNNLGSLLAQSGDTRGAEAAFRTALTINPYDSGTHANIGRLLAGEGDWKQAAFHLQKAIQLDPANANARGDYVVALLQMQRVPEAEAAAKAAVAADPKSARAHDLFGQILAQEKQSSPARREFEAALILDPQFGPAQLDLAEILIQQGQPGAAVPLLEKAEHSPIAEVAQRAQAMLQEFGSQ